MSQYVCWSQYTVVFFDAGFCGLTLLMIECYSLVDRVHLVLLVSQEKWVHLGRWEKLDQRDGSAFREFLV